MNCELISTDFLLPSSKMVICRTPGLHLSQIINSIASESGLDQYGETAGPPTLRMEMGFLWEDLLTVALKDRLPIRLGEIVQDGIIMSPDGIEEDTWELNEYKATWKSSRGNPADNWRWMTQIRAYCRAIATNVCNLKVLYVNGDYSRGDLGGPHAYHYRLTYTDRELQENWTMCTNHARKKGWIKR